MRHDVFDFRGFTRLALLQQKIGITAAQTVLSRSTLFLNGTLTPVEATAMWMEKPVALATGMQNAALSLVRGEGPSAVMEAALMPMATKTSANAKRLARR